MKGSLILYLLRKLDAQKDFCLFFKFLKICPSFKLDWPYQFNCIQTIVPIAQNLLDNNLSSLLRTARVLVEPSLLSRVLCLFAAILLEWCWNELELFSRRFKHWELRNRFKCNYNYRFLQNFHILKLKGKFRSFSNF